MLGATPNQIFHYVRIFFGHVRNMKPRGVTKRLRECWRSPKLKEAALKVILKITLKWGQDFDYLLEQSDAKNNFKRASLETYLWNLLRYALEYRSKLKCCFTMKLFMISRFFKVCWWGLGRYRRRVAIEASNHWTWRRVGETKWIFKKFF